MNRFGIGISPGIGIDAQPQADAARIISSAANIVILSPFLNFEHSPVNLYDMA